MFGFLTNLEITLAVGAAAFIAGVVFSQKVKDWFKGIPSELRSALKNVETDTLSKIKAAQATVLAELPKPPAAKTAAPATAAPVIPAPAPVAAAAAPAPAASAPPVTPPVV